MSVVCWWYVRADDSAACVRRSDSRDVVHAVLAGVRRYEPATYGVRGRLMVVLVFYQ